MSVAGVGRLLVVLLVAFLPAPCGAGDPLSVIVVKAHPDEAEEYCGGAAALAAAAGHRVKFLSLTNGDVGHWTMTKEDLAERRRREALEAGRRLGVTYEILPHHDGELESSVEVRKQVVRAIREWNADLVVSFKPVFGGGHPDNMASALAVQQGAGLCSAPLFMPEVPALKKRPLFLHVLDYYSKSLPHAPDLVVPIDSVIEKKLLSFDAHASQFYEFAPYQRGILSEVPAGWEARRAFLQRYWGEWSAVSSGMRRWLVDWYGEDKGEAFQFAEEFLLAPYSRKPERGELEALFPVLKVR